jgi:DNA-binding response OmpR family regulator
MLSPAHAGRILVIDDHVALAEGFARALRLAGFDVQVAHGAEAALQLAQAQQPDAIILDFQMPYVNGAGFLYRLRAHRVLRRTPVLVVTGQTLTAEIRDELRELDASVRSKPLGLTDLVAAARSLVGAR